MKFHKMHGLGNDFVVIDARKEALDYPQIARRICRRRLDVGADGLIAVEDGRECLKMRIFNADGSEAEMCGNGIRCFARFVYETGLVKTRTFSVETLAGIMRPAILETEGAFLVEVDMGKPLFAPEDIPFSWENPLGARLEAAGRFVEVYAVRMGVPHTIVFSELEGLPVDTLGRAIEHHPAFPERTNVNFVEICSPTCVRVCTWERGAGRTMACGTGASAVYAVLDALGRAPEKLEVALEAGSMWIRKQGGRVYMSGPAEWVYSGEWRV